MKATLGRDNRLFLTTMISLALSLGTSGCLEPSEDDGTGQVESELSPAGAGVAKPLFGPNQPNDPGGMSAPSHGIGDQDTDETGFRVEEGTACYGGGAPFNQNDTMCNDVEGGGQLCCEYECSYSCVLQGDGYAWQRGSCQTEPAAGTTCDFKTAGGATVEVIPDDGIM